VAVAGGGSGSGSGAGVGVGVGEGSVRVRDMFKIEAFPTVLQMTSTVVCAPRAGTALLDVLRALFPCGSITGAPKVAAMRAIAGLEAAPRAVYCGAVLHIAPGGGPGGADGDVTASVPIRTVLLESERGSGSGSGSGSDGEEDEAPCDAVYGVGGGVTFDSTASGEFDEALAKAAVLLAASEGGAAGGAEAQAGTGVGVGAGTGAWSGGDAGADLQLFETLRATCADGAGGAHRYALLGGHLRRLRASCSYFGFAHDARHVRAALDAALDAEPLGEEAALKKEEEAVEA